MARQVTLALFFMVREALDRELLAGMENSNCGRCPPHETLAIAAGATDRVWDIRDVIRLLEESEKINPLAR